jgi:multidrug efflux pump subunit AcrB
MFFMGATNAIFVGLSVPISMFLAFITLQIAGFFMTSTLTMNMIVLFSFLLALGIVVDDAIVVIENTHRIYHQNKLLNIVTAAKAAAGEVFVPVLAGTLTTLAPFVPLLFWPGIVGKFMYYMPFTLIITLTASLIVAFIINPVFAVSFMKREHGEEASSPEKKNRRFWTSIIILLAVSGLCYAASGRGLGNFMIFITLIVILNRYVFTGWIRNFQEKALPAFMNGYARLLSFLLRGARPYWVLLSVFLLLVASIVATAVRKPDVVFFPKGDPNFVYVYLSLPIGTDVNVTDSVTKILEKRVYQVIGYHNPDVESVISNVAVGAGDPSDPSSQGTYSYKGKVTVAFVEFDKRKGKRSSTYLDEIRKAVKGIPGAEITVDQERNGPPTGKPVNIEITGEDINGLVIFSKRVEHFIDSLNVPGVEDLRSDLQDQNPEIRVDIDREKANQEGISTYVIANELRTAVFGLADLQASKFKRDEDEYPINVRYSEQYRKNLDALINTRISYRDMATGLIRQIPLSAVAKISYGNTFGGIKRKNLKRMVTLSSNVLNGYNGNEVVAQIKKNLDPLKVPDGYAIKKTGEQEDQQETANFLVTAFMGALLLIIVILSIQFNSFSKPIIILTEILFSVTGVLLGFSIFNMSISIAMTGVGIVALAGIVVKNGILLVEFADVLKERGFKTVPAVVQAGRTRLNPVILTATATMLGLVPLALGMNINFFSLFSDFKPDFYLGGESSTFWGPLAWTIIFGLSFATFLTLLVVPCMYLINYKWKIGLKRAGVLNRNHKM